MKPRSIEAKLVGGPMAGHTMTVPFDTETIFIGNFFQYTFGGRVGKSVVFVIRPRNRATWRAILLFIQHTGRHPGLQYDEQKPVPHRGRTDKRGQGARRRAAKRAA